jgi:chromosomal replication initiator protein
MQKTAETIWAEAQEMLRSMLNPDIFKLWFLPVTAVGIEGDALVLEVANEFCELWLKDNYLGLLRDVVANIAAADFKIEFRRSIRPVKAAEAAPVPARGRARRDAERDSEPAAGDVMFNPKNTFETFVVGENNNHSHAAALAVAQAPGKSYNPLFLYGGVGLGKTHLLHAIGQHVGSQKKGARVAYFSSEKFTNEYIDAIQNNQVMRFRKKYRGMDVLLIDDVQFLAGKERIQEEFFHTFNALHEARKQIVLTSDRPANEIQNLENRLVSRFEWGLVTDLQPPDAETRLAILRKKAKLLSVDLADEILHFLANRIRSNIRRLEGALIRVTSYVSLTGKKATIETVEGLLREILQEEGRYAINIEAIQKRVAEHFDIRVSEMSSKRRPENIAFPRQIAMYLSRQMTENSFSAIGDAFGGRDHGTVLHACRLVKDRMEVDPNVRQTVSFLEKQLMR